MFVSVCNDIGTTFAINAYAMAGTLPETNKMLETKMNRIKNLVAISAFSLLILGLPAIASAQWNGGYGGNNGGNNNGGYYGNGNYNSNIRSTVKNLKNRAKSFEKAVDRYDDDDDDRYNRGGYGGYGNNNNYNGNLKNLADQFKDATDDLEDAYGNGRNMNNSADEARRVLDIASQIDRAIYNSGGGTTQNQWNSMRQDLNMLANAYGYNYNNRNNRNNRNRNGNWRNNIPFPLPF